MLSLKSKPTEKRAREASIFVGSAAKCRNPLAYSRRWQGVRSDLWRLAWRFHPSTATPGMVERRPKEPLCKVHGSLKSWTAASAAAWKRSAACLSSNSTRSL